MQTTQPDDVSNETKYCNSSVYREPRVGIRRPLDDVAARLPLRQLLAADAALPHLADWHLEGVPFRALPEKEQIGHVGQVEPFHQLLRLRAAGDELVARLCERMRPVHLRIRDGRTHVRTHT